MSGLTIAVDVTPMLPGEDSGGIKIFVLELLDRLSEMRPDVQFVLLSQVASHEELAVLDRPNMRRIMVVCPVATDSLRSRLVGIADRILTYFPARLRGVITGVCSAVKYRGTRALLRDMDVDLLFCPFTAPTYFVAGIPTVCTIYDLQYKVYPEFFTMADMIRWDVAFSAACRRATVLCAISDYLRDSAIAYGSLDPDRIRTINIRIAQQTMTADYLDISVLSSSRLTPQRYLIYPANYCKHKNHEMLLTAFGLACRIGLASDIKLVCTGASMGRQAWLMKAAGIMSLGDRVLFTGYLSNAESAALIAHCAGVVFPSLYEDFCPPLVEAMAMGIPVACSDSTSLPEMAAEGAILFDPRIPTLIAQSIITLVDHEWQRVRLSNAGRRRAQELSDSERMAREYWDLFHFALTYENSTN